MKMWKQWMALLMIFCLLMPGALAGSIDLTDDLDEEVGSVTESSAGEDYTISDNGDIILDDDDDLGGDVIFDDDGSTIEITDNEIDDTIDPDKLDINTNLPSNVVNILLVGVDTRSTSLDDGLQNGDVQIIVSINKDDGSIKLTSILRDLYVTIPGYKNNRRPQTMDREPPVSVVVPLFSEDYSFVEERLPLILAQNYPDFEVVIVYVGHDTDFYEELVRLKQSFPQITTTKIHLDPRFPISRKMALNVGIKSAHYECMVFTSTDAVPQTDRWLSLMAKGFMRGEIVVGYCGVERGKGFSNYMMRAWRMMHSADWIARAVQRRAYRGTLHNYGFTKSLYFGANGFSHLNMNIGEDDLFMQRVMTRDNVSVILSPRASLREKMWGGMGWWMSQLRYFGSAFRFYPRAVKTFVRWEIGSRVLFFATVVCALAVMPPEYKLAALLLAVIRYVVVAFEVRRIARRLGEGGIAGRYFIYDLLGPLWAAALGAMLLRRDNRVWR